MSGDTEERREWRYAHRDKLKPDDKLTIEAERILTTVVAKPPVFRESIDDVYADIVQSLVRAGGEVPWRSE